MYTYTPRTVAAIRADLDKINREINELDEDDDAALLADLHHDRLTIIKELDEAGGIPKDEEEMHAPTGGLDLVKVARAFGPNLPKDWDE